MEEHRVRIRDIAEELGLSTATVSNVIHGKTKKISDETVKRVMELVEETVKILTRQILAAYALIAPFKVINMILGGGILRSGGRTKYVMVIDIIGTWCFGVPLGLLAAFALRLSIPYVYFILSLEECIRFGISLAVFRNKGWMNQLEASVTEE